MAQILIIVLLVCVVALVSYVLVLLWKKTTRQYHTVQHQWLSIVDAMSNRFNLLTTIKEVVTRADPNEESLPYTIDRTMNLLSKAYNRQDIDKGVQSNTMFENSVLPQLAEFVMNHPRVRSERAFLDLERRDIQQSRQEMEHAVKDYNKIVSDYNNKISVAPNKQIAHLRNMEKQTRFMDEQYAKENNLTFAELEG